MSDTKLLLARASRSAPDVPFGPEEFRRFQERRDRVRRIRAGAVGLTLAAVAATVAFTALQGGEAKDVDGQYASTGATLPPATRPPSVAAPGQLYYRAVLFVRAGCQGEPVQECSEGGVRLDATSWWSPEDDSGRIAVDDAQAYGIEAGRFGPGEFPNHNGIDVSGFP